MKQPRLPGGLSHWKGPLCYGSEQSHNTAMVQVFMPQGWIQEFEMGGGVLTATLQVKRGIQGGIYIEFRSKGGGVRTLCKPPLRSSPVPHSDFLLRCSFCTKAFLGNRLLNYVSIFPVQAQGGGLIAMPPHQQHQAAMQGRPMFMPQMHPMQLQRLRQQQQQQQSRRKSLTDKKKMKKVMIMRTDV